MRKIFIGLLFVLSIITEVVAQVPDTGKQGVNSIEEMLEQSKLMLRRPYRSGGMGPYAFDCSGYTCYCYQLLGIKLPHSSQQQSEIGKKIRRSKKIRPGDLVFYKGTTGDNIGHVGIVIEKDTKKTFKFIHASSSVGITITSGESDYFKQRFVKVMRITDDDKIEDAIEQKEKEEKRVAKEEEKARKKQLKEEKRAAKEQKKKEKEEAKIEKKKEKEAEKETTQPQSLKTLTGKTYIVKKGDTLYNISKRAVCSVEDLKKWNNLTGNDLFLGQELIIKVGKP